MPTPRDPATVAAQVGDPVTAVVPPSPRRGGLPEASTPAGAALRVAAVVAALIGIAYNLVGFPPLREFGAHYRIDLDVYRLGGAALADSAALYGAMPPTAIGNHLPFTYPPLAAIVFSPLSLISLDQASAILTVVTLAALLATIALTLRSLGIVDRATATWTAVAVFAGALVLEPVYSTLDYGQVNIVLMALVAADCLLPRTPWPRGLLVGIVAAIKLTPAVFVLYFLLRKDFRATITTGLGFLGGTALGFLVTFDDAKQYWTDTLLDSNRIGRPAYPANQSITGMLARLGLEGATRSAIWIVCCGLVFVLAVVAARRALAAGHAALALSAVAVLGLLASPVSWSHHWVWVIPLLMVFGYLALRGAEQEPRRRALWTGWTVGGIALFVIAPHWRLTPGRSSGLDWPIVDQVLASSYVWWGVATLVLLALVRLPARPTAVVTGRREAVPAPAS